MIRIKKKHVSEFNPLKTASEFGIFKYEKTSGRNQNCEIFDYSNNGYSVVRKLIKIKAIQSYRGSVC
jgi:hypothetical protein